MNCEDTSYELLEYLILKESYNNIIKIINKSSKIPERFSYDLYNIIHKLYSEDDIYDTYKYCLQTRVFQTKIDINNIKTSNIFDIIKLDYFNLDNTDFIINMIHIISLIN